MSINIQKLVCTGDSLVDNTWDFYLNVNSQFFHWSDILSRQTGIDMTNTGIAGQTIEYVSQHLDSMVFVHKPTHCIIDGGANDYWWVSTDVDRITSFMSHALNLIKSKGITPILLWMPVDHRPLNLTCPSEIPKRYERLAKYLNVPFINFEGSLMGNTPNVNYAMKLLDGVHNNLHGNLYSAEVILNFLKDNYTVGDLTNLGTPKPSGSIQTKRKDKLHIAINNKKVNLYVDEKLNKRVATSKIEWRY